MPHLNGKSTNHTLYAIVSKIDIYLQNGMHEGSILFGVEKGIIY